ncbi:unnamed protein product [Pleuronectes platessa]|uniref:Uncharacterized protein n=1 Tax=Pleuronectes platessa TaxID=8262 RepID=A0A9N7Z9Q0_PLEPL|nr:unnamed protein product [Pleuronectes platessa]
MQHEPARARVDRRLGCEACVSACTIKSPPTKQRERKEKGEPPSIAGHVGALPPFFPVPLLCALITIITYAPAFEAKIVSRCVDVESVHDAQPHSSEGRGKEGKSRCVEPRFAIPEPIIFLFEMCSGV